MNSFITALHVLALLDDLIRDRIVVGLRDRRISEQLQIDPKLKLESTILMTRENEIVKKQQLVIRESKNSDEESSMTTASMDAVKYTGGKQENQKKPWQARATSRPKPNGHGGCGTCRHATGYSGDKCPAREVKCHKCGNRGHFAKFYRSTNIAKMDESGSTNGSFDQLIPNKENHGIQTLRSQFLQVNFKIDTGADVTVIPESVYKQLKGVEILHVNKSLHWPGNTKLNV